MSKNIVKYLHGFFQRLIEMFGTKLIILFVTVFLINEGFVYSLVNLNQLPYFKNVLKINETKYQIYCLITWSPWSMKAILAAISDLFPLFGFQKSSYMFISGLMGTAALGVLAFVDIKQNMLIIAPAMMFVVMLELSVIDLLCEGRYSKILADKKIEQGDIITFVWICRIIGQMIGGSIIGVLVTRYNASIVYLICFIVSFPCLFFTLGGFLGDPYIPNWHRKFYTRKMKNQWRLFTLAILIALCNFGMIIVNVFTEKKGFFVLIYSLVSSTALLSVAFVFLPLPLAKCNLYIFLQESMYIRIMGALDYWYTADESCVPGGPHFGMVFYLTITMVISCVSGVIGILIFQNFTQNWTFRFAFMFSVLLRAVGSLFDIFIVTRTNISIGLPDKLTLIFGDAVIMDIAYILAKMPALLLTARLVHRGYESTIYAILSGYHDFGKSVSIGLGTELMVFAGIDFTSSTCQYANLSKLIWFSHFIMPLLALPFIFVLIPNVRLSDVTAFDTYKDDQLYGDMSHDEDTADERDQYKSSEEDGPNTKNIDLPFAGEPFIVGRE